MIFSTMAIEDRKAMIMIRTNSTIISALIVFNNYIDQNVVLASPIQYVMVIGGMFSLLLALFAAKPASFKLVQLIKENLRLYPKLSQNNFIVFRKMGLEEFEESMAEVSKNQDLQIGNQVRGNYILGQYWPIRRCS